MLFPRLLKYGDGGLFVLRFAVGVVFIYHCVPKLTNTVLMAEAMRFPYWFVLLLGFTELCLGVALIVGIKTQLAAFVLGIDMLGAIYFKNFVWAVPFAAGNRTGWEFDFILLAGLAALFLTGGGHIGIAETLKNTGSSAEKAH